MTELQLPRVSLVIAMRNEERYVDRTLNSALQQRYPADRLECIVVDGQSTDGSRAMVESIMARDRRVRLLTNSKRISPAGWNAGIRAATGDVIGIVSAHSWLAPDYVEKAVDVLRETGAEAVGGPMRAEGETPAGRMAALATSSPFGVGDSLFRISNTPRYVETVFMGLYRRDVFERVGLFDEARIATEDEDFNHRLRKSGGRIFMDPSIHSRYTVRGTIPLLWHQYFRYGKAKVSLLQKDVSIARWRHLVPALFTASLLLGLIGIRHRFVRRLMSSELRAYLFLSLFFSLKIGGRYAPGLPLMFGILHGAYGLGFIVGLIQRLPSLLPFQAGRPSQQRI